MSYSGYREYISEIGTYFTSDCWGEDLKFCPNSKSPVKYTRNVDTTNGYEEGNPYSHSAEKIHTGKFFDIWKQDRFGNKFAVSLKLYSPADLSLWAEI